MSEYLICHHVGGRGGSRGFPVLPAFESDIVNVLYDADPDCIEQIKEYWQKQDCETIVLPHCLSDDEGAVIFRQNYDPYTCSIYPFNERYAKWYYPEDACDYILGDTFRAVRNVDAPVTTLDKLVEDRKVDAPDFLSIDAQGAELRILRGARHQCYTSVLAVLVEVEFHELYEGQPLFGSVCGWLNDRGFDLADVKVFAKLHPMRGKVRGEGYAAHGEALFLRRLEAIKDPLQLSKLAFIAIVFNRFELAEQCTKEFLFCPSSHRWYLHFVRRWAEALKQMPARNRPRFTDLYSQEQSYARFAVHTRPQIRKMFADMGPLIAVLKWLTVPKRWLTTSLNNLRAHLRYGLTPMEKLLLEYRLQEQYRVAITNRIKDRT